MKAADDFRDAAKKQGDFCGPDENGFTSMTELGVSAFRYDRILALAEDDKYFIFVYSESHAQIYDKRTIAGGTPEEFRAFMEGMTGKQVIKV